jgi:hypothetical protein
MEKLIMANENKNITFCVETKTLDDDKVKQLHQWCMGAGARHYDSVDEWLAQYHEVGYKYIGVMSSLWGLDTYLCGYLEHYDKNLIKYEEVPAFLGLCDEKPLTITHLQQLCKDCGIISIEIRLEDIIVYHDSTERNYTVKDEEELVQLCNVLKMLDKFEYQEG